MCMMFGCCGPPPFATIKAYNNTTPFALDWYDDRDGGAGGIRETAIIDWNDETGYTIGVLSVGDGAEVTGSTNEKAVVERDADDGDRQTESSSSPLVAAGVTTPTTMIKMTAVSGPSGGAWLWYAHNSPVGHTFNFFDLDIAQLCSVSHTGASTAVRTMSVGIRSNGDLITGIGGTSSEVARVYNTSGTLLDTMTRSDLTNSGYTLNSDSALIPRDDGVSTFLVFGRSGVGGNTRRHLWVCDKSTLAESVVGTPVAAGSTAGAYHPLSTGTPARGPECGKASRITSSYAMLFLSDGSSSEHPEDDATIVCVDMSSASESWTKSDKTRRFVALDSTQVYTLDPTAGELSAVTLSGGGEAWTLDLSDEDKLGTGTGQVYGAVLSSGNIAVWRNKGVTIVSTSGTEVATVDVGPCYGIVEKSSRWIIVGAKRTTSA